MTRLRLGIWGQDTTVTLRWPAGYHVQRHMTLVCPSGVILDRPVGMLSGFVVTAVATEPHGSAPLG